MRHQLSSEDDYFNHSDSFTLSFSSTLLHSFFLLSFFEFFFVTSHISYHSFSSYFSEVWVDVDGEHFIIQPQIRACKGESCDHSFNSRIQAWAYFIVATIFSHSE